MSDQYLFNTIRALTGNENRVSAERVYCEAMGNDLTGGMFLSQLIFWCDKGKRADGFFYKTAAEWEEETYLSTYLVRKYTKQCEELGWLETKVMKADGSPTVHYRVDRVKFSKWICEFSQNYRKSNFHKSLTDLTTDLTTEKGSVASEVNEQPNTAAPPPPLRAFDKSIPTKKHPVSQNGIQPPPAVADTPFLVNGMTAGELAKQRGQAKKYSPEYDWKIHRPVYEALVDIMGVQALVDADDARVIGDYQDVAVILVKAGQTAETVLARKEKWQTTWPGNDGGSLSQLKMFLVRQSPATPSTANVVSIPMGVSL